MTINHSSQPPIAAIAIPTNPGSTTSALCPSAPGPATTSVAGSENSRMSTGSRWKYWHLQGSTHRQTANNNSKQQTANSNKNDKNNNHNNHNKHKKVVES